VRLFVYEYASASPSPVADSIRAEGRAMLAAVVEDFARLPAIEVITLTAEGDDEAAFRSAAGSCDLSLIIAPEFDDLLLTRCRWVVESGGRLVGASPEAVILAADKLELARHLARRGIPTPPCWSVGRGQAHPPFPPPWVWKPRKGAGSLATFLVSERSEWPGLATADAEGGRRETVLQPFVPGRAASAAFLTGPRGMVSLPPAEQELSPDGRFRYRGGRAPLRPALAARATRLARRALETLPGLSGYVGVDLVLGDAEDGSADWVIDVNPRVTTSYVGLRALARGNLAEAMLAAARGERVAPLEWKPGVVSFRADGRSMVLPR
jgi:predicted ATP-grasp superfamily ATP-dependent carboligase